MSDEAGRETADAIRDKDLSVTIPVTVRNIVTVRYGPTETDPTRIVWLRTRRQRWMNRLRRWFRR